MALMLESANIADGRPIPEVYAVAVPTPEGRAAMEGRDRSPHLRWSGEPARTRSFAISVVDPDVPADRNRMGGGGLSLGDGHPYSLQIGPTYRSRGSALMILDRPSRVCHVLGSELR